MAKIRAYTKEDLSAMTQIWNEVVEDGVAFPQTEPLSALAADEFFSSQSFTGVAEQSEKVVGLYIFHPNNIGRCGHIGNASYAVARSQRGNHIGEELVKHSLNKGRELGFKILQFNAVVKSNIGAVHLYEKLGFVKLGEIPAGFRLKDGSFDDILLFFHNL